MKLDTLFEEHLFPACNTLPGFFHTISGGHHICASPVSYETPSSPACLLLYTNQDSLSLMTGEGTPQVQVLAANSLLFLPAGMSFRLDIMMPGADFYFLAFEGDAGAFYFSEMAFEHGFLYLETYPSSLLSPLRAIYSTISDSKRLLMHHRYLTDFLTDCLLFQKKIPERDFSAVPNYLLEIKSYLDHFYTEAISLKVLEERSGYNQYRICRDFSHYFEISPLQYLNRLRLEKAKKLLLTSDVPIHEVGSMVGIDNTTHFINLFKRSEHVTPLVYREQNGEV